MGKAKVTVQDDIAVLADGLKDVLPAAMSEALALDSTQRGAVTGGLAAAVQGLNKAVLGLTGQYVAKPREKKTPEK